MFHNKLYVVVVDDAGHVWVAAIFESEKAANDYANMSHVKGRVLESTMNVVRTPDY